MIMPISSLAQFGPSELASRGSDQKSLEEDDKPRLNQREGRQQALSLSFRTKRVAHAPVNRIGLFNLRNPKHHPR